MDSKDVKQTEEVETQESKQGNQEKGSQSKLLIVLIAILGGFSYLYFFTDIIRPQVENKPAEAPAVPQNEKKALPPRDGSAVKNDATTATAEKKEPVVATAAEPAKVVPATKPATSVEPQAKPVVEPKKATPAKATEKKAVAAAPEAKEKKQHAAKKAETKTGTAEAPVKAGVWTVLAGNYFLEGKIASDQAKIKKAGLEPVIKAGARKKTMMNRLLLAGFEDRSAAKAELAKLMKHTSDAFILDHGGKHYVYAGSYLLDSRAASEIERLAAAGFTLTLKREEVSIPSKNLTAGEFSDKKSAEAAVKKLKDSGINATLKHQ